MGNIDDEMYIEPQKNWHGEYYYIMFKIIFLVI